MKSMATFLLALTLAVVGVGGYLYLQRLENRVVALEAQLQILQEGNPGTSAKATLVQEIPPQKEPGPQVEARPQLASEADSRSYLNELLQRTK